MKVARQPKIRHAGVLASWPAGIEGKYYRKETRHHYESSLHDFWLYLPCPSSCRVYTVGLQYGLFLLSTPFFFFFKDRNGYFVNVLVLVLPCIILEEKCNRVFTRYYGYLTLSLSVCVWPQSARGCDLPQATYPLPRPSVRQVPSSYSPEEAQKKKKKKKKIGGKGHQDMKA